MDRNSYNPKRRIEDAPDRAYLGDLLGRLRYGGNPEHKRNPGDFGLVMSTTKRPDASLCDAVDITTVAAALAELQKGVDAGLISRQKRGDFPQNIWVVHESGLVLEAQLENQGLGTYHGYPMDPADPFVAKIREAVERHV